MNGMETEGFETALALEEQREQTLPAALRYARPHAYFSRGLYAAMLRPYLDRFPPSQILCVTFDSIIREPQRLASRLHRCLGVAERPGDAAGLDVVNPSERHREPMRGDADPVATLACALQDPPDVVSKFIDAWQRGADIVWGKRATRDESWLRVWTSRTFERLIRRHAMPPRSKFTTGSFLLVDRAVAECFARFQEHNRVTFALVAWTGFSEEVVTYERQRRRTGASGWTYGRMVKTMYDTFIGFSQTPIRVMTITGALVSLLTIPMAGYILYHRLSGHPILGWTSIMLPLTLFFGLQFLM